MAILTWKNVTAPDATGAAALLGVANRSLQDAGGAFTGALDDYQAGVQRNLNEQNRGNINQFLQNVVARPDSASIGQGLQDRSLFSGVDASRLTPTDFQMANTQGTTLDNRAASVISRDQSQFNLNTAVYDQDREVANNVGADYLARNNQLLTDAIGRKDFTAVEQIKSDMAKSGVKLGMEQQKQFEGMVTSADAAQVSDWIEKASLTPEGTPELSQETLYAKLNQLRKATDISPAKAAMLDSYLTKTFPAYHKPALIEGDASDPDATATAANPTAVAPGTPGRPNYNSTLSNTKLPGGNNLEERSLRSLAEDNNTLRAVRVGKDAPATGSNSSAMGAYQIVGETREMLAKAIWAAEQAKPANERDPAWNTASWGDVLYTGAVQERMAKTLYEQNKNKDMTKIWAGLSTYKKNGGTDYSTPGYFKDMSWEEARKLILPTESGSGVAGGTAASEFTPAQVKEAADRGQPFTLALRTGAGSDLSTDNISSMHRALTVNSERATEIIKSSIPDLKTAGAKNNIPEQIQDLMSRGIPEGERKYLQEFTTKLRAKHPELPESVLSAVVLKSTEAAVGVIGTMVNWAGFSGDKMDVNSDSVKAFINQYKSGASSQALTKLKSFEAAQASLEKAIAKRDEAVKKADSYKAATRVGNVSSKNQKLIKNNVTTATNDLLKAAAVIERYVYDTPGAAPLAKAADTPKKDGPAKAASMIGEEADKVTQSGRYSEGLIKKKNILQSGILAN